MGPCSAVCILQSKMTEPRQTGNPASVTDLARGARPVRLSDLLPRRDAVRPRVDQPRWVRDLVDRTALPAELVSALVFTFAARALRDDPRGAIPEGRSAILKQVMDLLQDAVFEAVREVRPLAPVSDPPSP